AKAALQAMTLLERRLHRMQFAVGREAFDGRDLGAFRLDGKDRARLDRVTVDQHGAGTALPGVAADVRAGQSKVVADEIDEQRARIDFRAYRLVVDGK